LHCFLLLYFLSFQYVKDLLHLQFIHLRSTISFHNDDCISE